MSVVFPLACSVKKLAGVVKTSPGKSIIIRLSLTYNLKGTSDE